MTASISITNLLKICHQCVNIYISFEAFQLDRLVASVLHTRFSKQSKAGISNAIQDRARRRRHSNIYFACISARLSGSAGKARRAIKCDATGTGVNLHVRSPHRICCLLISCPPSSPSASASSLPTRFKHGKSIGLTFDASRLAHFELQSLPPAVMRRLMRELAELKNSPPEGVRVVTSEDNMLDVTGIIEGPGKYCF